MYVATPPLSLLDNHHHQRFDISYRGASQPGTRNTILLGTYLVTQRCVCVVRSHSALAAKTINQLPLTHWVEVIRFADVAVRSIDKTQDKSSRSERRRILLDSACGLLPTNDLVRKASVERSDRAGTGSVASQSIYPFTSEVVVSFWTRRQSPLLHLQARHNESTNTKAERRRGPVRRRSSS